MEQQDHTGASLLKEDSLGQDIKGKDEALKMMMPGPETLGGFGVITRK